MNFLKNRLLQIFIIVPFFTLFLDAKEPKKQYVIATASAGGTYYPVGIGLATIANKKLSDTNNMLFSAITSAGSAENITLLENKEADFAIIQGLFGSMAWQGKATYEGDVKKDLRAISMLWHEVEQFIISSEYVTTGNIKDIQNLYGKSFSIGGKNSGTRVSTEIILDSLDISANKMSLEYLGYTAGANALYEGKIDGMNPLGGVPTSAICNVFIRLGPKKIKMLEFTKEDLLKINENYPIWIPYVIKADTYPDQKEDIHTVAQPSLLVVTKDTPEETVYLLTKTIYENLPFLHTVHDATKAISLNKATLGLPMPLHRGAAKFYKEKGIEITDHIID
jgi:TRAP transporter TAXI family solute receptor